MEKISEFPLFGRTCKLGWGYNTNSDEFVDLKHEPEGVKEELFRKINIECKIVSSNSSLESVTFFSIFFEFGNFENLM